jgi:hypothetical protein
MSHNPSAKRNRQFRSGETRGRRQVCGLAAAVTPLPSAPTRGGPPPPPPQQAPAPAARVATAGPATAASPASPVSPGNPADKTG